MPAPSVPFTDIPAADFASGKGGLTTTGIQLRDNDVHIEEWLGLDYTAAQNHDHDGLNSAPIFGANLAWLASYDISSAVASIDVNSVITSLHRRYLVFYRLRPATDGVNLWLRTSTDNGGSFLATAGYDVAADYMITTGARFGLAGTNVNQINLSAGDNIGNAAGEACAGRFVVHDPTDAAVRTMIDFSAMHQNPSGDLRESGGCGHRDAAEDNDAIQIKFSSGNIAAGQVAVYGLREV